MRPLTFQN